MESCIATPPPDLSLDRLEEGIKHIPALSETVQRVLATLDAGDFDYEQLRRLIEQDPGLSARLLQIANSALYGFPGSITSVKEACRVLGVTTVRQLTLSVGVLNEFPATDESGFDRAGFWLHCTGCGAAARLLAPHCELDPDQAFTAGLLHDLGKLVEDVYFPRAFARVLAHRDAHECSLREAEVAVLGFDHALIGGRLARHWELPDDLIDAIEGHHRTDAADNPPLADLVHVADGLCRAVGIGHGGDALAPRLSAHALARLGLDKAALKPVAQTLQKLVRDGDLLA